MDLLPLSVLIVTIIHQTSAVRLNTLFQHLDGYKGDYYLKGWLHVGTNYAILLRKPEAHAKYLTYELYESKNIDDLDTRGPQLLAISKVPVDYIKQQLKTFGTELHSAKYLEPNAVPGTQVRTLREWQISRALSKQGENKILKTKPKVLRTRIDNDNDNDDDNE
ncbi:uncharacterized protein LOC128673764 [Plodia interpunctella]|uniref:uncharacterized protein LOC128673764 n=1 Tax=Plodia interpunctella TaxID=58824 RepID=UPI00236743D8|nr:uncharacterized protein LOC128673764 [Plodia interpunctella]